MGSSPSDPNRLPRTGEGLWPIGQAAALCIVLLISLLLFDGWFSYSTLRELNESSARIAQSRAILNAAAELRDAARNTVISARNFVITGEPATLATYRQAASQVPARAEQLKRLTGHDPSQHSRVARMEQQISGQLDLAERSVRLRSQEGYEAARQLLAAEIGRFDQDDADFGMAELAAVEREDRPQDRYWPAISRMVMMGLATASMIGLAAWFLRRDWRIRAFADAQLTASEERFRTIAKAIPSMIWTAAPDGTITFASQQWHDYSGLSPENGAHDWLRLSLHPDDHDRYLATWGRALESGNACEIEVRNRRHDGVYRWFLTRATPVRDGRGQVSSWFGTTTDIHDRKLGEEALRESEMRFRAMADGAPVMIWTANVDQERDFFNRGWLDFTGRSLDQEYGAGWIDLVHPDDRDRCRKTFLKAFAARASFEKEFRLKRHDGEYRWIFDRGVPRFTPDGSFSGYVGCGTDITERRQTQQRLNLLVSELRHRVKNLIAIMQSIMVRTMIEDRSIAEARDILQGRLLALGRAQDLLTRANWHGAPLRGIVEAELAGFSERLDITGPDIMLNAGATQTMALALHELATNAVKHGALSCQGGRVEVRWAVSGHDSDARLKLRWQESGGPPALAPQRKGFGLTLLSGALMEDFDTPPRMIFAPDGFTFEVDAPIAVLSAFSLRDDSGGGPPWRG